ncbi:hypothetical protein Z695_0115025 [Pseudomonas aeruginosa SG17M]|nr:hypothetical protein Z695_0115025 [Pseudomonas aeruginosa SG17M]
MFQIPIQILVRIQLRGVCRQEEQFDLLFAVGDPGAHLFAVVYAQVVEKQDFPEGQILHGSQTTGVCYCLMTSSMWGRTLLFGYHQRVQK